VAHIRKLGRNRWQARYRDDEHREHAHNFETRAAAQDWLDDATAGRVRGDYVDPRAGRVLVDLCRALVRHDRRPQTEDSTRLPANPRRARSATVGDRRAPSRHGLRRLWMGRTDRDDALGFDDPQGARALRNVLDLAVADRRLAVNPAARVKQPRLPLVQQRFLTIDKLTSLANETVSDRDRLLVLVLGWTGLRFGEAIALRRSDVDVLRRRIRVERSAVEVGAEIISAARRPTRRAR
jgi:hypothetical protein